MNPLKIWVSNQGPVTYLWIMCSSFLYWDCNSVNYSVNLESEILYFDSDILEKYRTKIVCCNVLN